MTATGHASGDHGPDGGYFQSDHGGDHGIVDRYKLVLFNNEVLRLDSVSGTVWILNYQRDPKLHQVIKPHWVIVAPPPHDGQ